MATKRRRARRSTMRAAQRPLAALRPVAWSAVVGAAFAVVVTVPAYGDPPGVPDPGTKPVPSSGLRLPGAASTTVVVPPVPGPLATQIMAAETEVATLGEQLNALLEQRDAASRARDEAERKLREATDRLNEVREAVDSAAEEAYKAATVLEPFGSFGADLRGLGRLMPPTAAPEQAETTPWDLARAEEDERKASSAYNEARLVEQKLTNQYATLDATRASRTAALIKLKQDNAAQLARVEAEREAYEQSLAGRYGKAGTNVHGEASNPDAVKALQYALRQLGKPYEWGAEGPDRYDCSGLVWAAYRSVGKSLPRVANDQYRATTPITVDKLLPGDLVFFATDRSDWRSIHHVGIYLGDNKMVHAPTTGELVQISTVWWSRFFGATRVLPAVPAPPANSPPPPPSSPSPTPTPTSPPPTVPTIPRRTSVPTISTSPSQAPASSESTSPDPTSSESVSSQPSSSGSPTPA